MGDGIRRWTKMRTPYFLERWRIAKAQSEDRRDFEDIVQQQEGSDDNGDEAEDKAEAE